MLHVWYVSFYLHWVNKAPTFVCKCRQKLPFHTSSHSGKYFHPAWLSGATFGSTKPSRKTKPQSVFPKKIHLQWQRYIWHKNPMIFYKTSLDMFMIFLMAHWAPLGGETLDDVHQKVPGALLNTLACVKTSKAMSASRALWSKFVEVLWCFQILYALKSNRIHVWHIYLHLVYFMVNVGKYTIHGSYGNSWRILPKVLLICFFVSWGKVWR